MATPKRKSPSEYMEAQVLIGIMAQLTTSKFFEIALHTSDDYSYIKELFQMQLTGDPNYLAGIERISECTILLDNIEYQNLVLQLSGSKEMSKKTIRYIHSFEIRDGEMCVFNLFRDINRRLKPRATQKRVSLAKPAAPKSQPAQEAELSPEKLLAQLQRQLTKALKTEDYRFAATLQKRIDEIKNK